MKYPKVSVIIPTYNRASLLPRAIKSVLNQTFKDFELIIVDDCSTDNTEEVVEEFQKKDKRIKYLRLKKNSGAPAHPRNVGIKNSQGKYIAFLDNDDEWLPEKLEKQLNLFEKTNNPKLGFVGGNVLIVEENRIKEYKVPKCGDNFQNFLSNCLIKSTSSVMIRKIVLEDVNLFDESLESTDDWEMWIRISQKYDFDFVSEPIFKYYFHQQNLSRSKNFLEKIKDNKYIIEKHKAIYKKYPLRKSIMIRRVGVLYLLNGDLKEARRHFFKAIKIAPWYLRNWVNLIVSFFGIKVYKRTIFLKQKFSEVFY